MRVEDLVGAEGIINLECHLCNLFFVRTYL